MHLVKPWSEVAGSIGKTPVDPATSLHG